MDICPICGVALAPNLVSAIKDPKQPDANCPKGGPGQKTETWLERIDSLPNAQGGWARLFDAIFSDTDRPERKIRSVDLDDDLLDDLRSA